MSRELGRFCLFENNFKCRGHAFLSSVVYHRGHLCYYEHPYCEKLYYCLYVCRSVYRCFYILILDDDTPLLYVDIGL